LFSPGIDWNGFQKEFISSAWLCFSGVNNSVINQRGNL
jgi:hypothetical protein